jgi:hypothetical protein
VAGGQTSRELEQPAAQHAGGADGRVGYTDALCPPQHVVGDRAPALQTDPAERLKPASQRKDPHQPAPHRLPSHGSRPTQHVDHPHSGIEAQRAAASTGWARRGAVRYSTTAIQARAAARGRPRDDVVSTAL